MRSLGTNSSPAAYGFRVGVGRGGWVGNGGCVAFGGPVGPPGDGDGDSIGFGTNPQIVQKNRP